MWSVYFALFKTSVAHRLQYRASLLIWLMSMIVHPLIFLVVWSTVAGAGSIRGYSASDFATYYIVLMLVEYVVTSWVPWQFDEEIREGKLSPKLIKPVNPMHLFLFDSHGHKPFTFAVLLPVAALLAWHFDANMAIGLPDVALFAPALILAFGIRWLVDYTVALIAFWTTRMSAFRELYLIVFWFLSGWFAPHALLPSWLQTITAISPFRWTLAFPIEVLLGRLDNPAILQGLLIQCLWIGLAFAAYRVAWAAGVRR
ncbi:MAG: ABC transporter permease [Dehalococcoidia bacterium]|nr:ABC transporter permease [Dehalococcoidia bacterium]